MISIDHLVGRTRILRNEHQPTRFRATYTTYSLPPRVKLRLYLRCVVKSSLKIPLPAATNPAKLFAEPLVQHGDFRNPNTNSKSRLWMRNPSYWSHLRQPWGFRRWAVARTLAFVRRCEVMLTYSTSLLRGLPVRTERPAVECTQGLYGT